MNISLGGLTLDGQYTTAREMYEEIGGRNTRQIEITGMVVGANSVEDIETRLDAVLCAASEDGYGTELLLRPGRRALVRRLKYARELSRDTLVGRFAITLEAQDPFDESVTPVTLDWSITASGATDALAAAGNLAAPLTINLVAIGDLVNPSFSDGINELVFSGLVAQGETLAFDGEKKQIRIGDQDRTYFATGGWPCVYPGGSSLIYTDCADSSHQAQALIIYRDRWW